MKCDETEDEPETTSTERVYQLSCFIAQGKRDGIAQGKRDVIVLNALSFGYNSNINLPSVFSNGVHACSMSTNTHVRAKLIFRHFLNFLNYNF